MSSSSKKRSSGAPKVGYVRGESDAVGRVLATLAMDDGPARQRALDELARQRREVADLFVAETLRRARERREAIAAAAAAMDEGSDRRRAA